MRHFITCDICGAAGHGAGRCPLREIEERKDPRGEALRLQTIRDRERARLDRGKPEMIVASVQTSRGFGL
jgi:hypothetical protein